MANINITELIEQPNRLPADINSVYKDTGLYNDGVNTFFGNVILPVPIPTNPDDVYYTVQAGDANRLDNISYQFYSTPDLWWAILLANNLLNPFEVVSGMILRIPPIAVIRSTLVS